MSSPSRSRIRRHFRRLAACPDCSSTVRVSDIRGQVARVQVSHDATCPWWRGRGAQEFSDMKVVPRW